MALYSLNRKERHVKLNRTKAQPNAIRLRYFRVLRAFLKPMFAYVLERLEPIMVRRLGSWKRTWRNDAIDDEINNVLSALRDHILVGSRDIRDSLEGFAKDTSAQNAELLTKAIGINVQMFSPTQRQAITDFVDDNVSLIRTMSEDLLGDVEKEVLEAFKAGDRWEDLSSNLQERFGVTESNAERIARDQIGKLNGQFNAKRQQDLGVEEYIWAIVGDGRVRDSHEAREGQRFRWDRPPPGGHPGEAIQCRCIAEPILKEFEEIAA